MKEVVKKQCWLFLFVLLVLTPVLAQQGSPSLQTKEGDYVIQNFKFGDGSSLPAVKMHYTTLGTPKRDSNGQVTNAVLILHGTNRKGGVFLTPSFAGKLFGSGQPLDASRYFIILPDQLGAGLGKSTKPSDGLHAKFPNYDYGDMIQANQLLMTQGLQISHLRLLVGVSMGCMEGFQWGESNPGFTDAMMLLSCVPDQVAGRNRMVRKIMIDDVRNDPGWKNGDYTEQPYGLRAAMGHMLVIGSVPVMWQKQYPTGAAADKFVDQYIEENFKTTDANDLIYQYGASRNYSPAADLGKITTHVTLVNFPEDFWNPSEIDTAQRLMPKVKNGKFILVPWSPETRGHYSFFVASLWEKYLTELLQETSAH